jgi:hypothetical protein
MTDLPHFTMGRGHFDAACPLDREQQLGEEKMRSNSGRDESRNNLRDPTVRDRSMGRGKPASGRRKLTAPSDQREGRKD